MLSDLILLYREQWPRQFDLHIMGLQRVRRKSHLRAFHFNCGARTHPLTQLYVYVYSIHFTQRLLFAETEHGTSSGDHDAIYIYWRAVSLEHIASRETRCFSTPVAASCLVLLPPRAGVNKAALYSFAAAAAAAAAAAV
jgi:hypothetical protein